MSTSAIADEARIAKGSLFMYFETKAHLYRDLYLHLIEEAATAARAGLEDGSDARAQLSQAWSNLMTWTAGNAPKRWAIARLRPVNDASSELDAVHRACPGLAGVIDDIQRACGIDTRPRPFVNAMATALAETTMDFVASDPANAPEYSRVGLAALWRLLSRSRLE